MVAAETSRQIVAARVICIFFMLSVNVSPGFDAATYGPGDAMHWIGALWVDVPGRSSVPALSIVSGFLMSAQVGRRSFGQTALDRIYITAREPSGGRSRPAAPDHPAHAVPPRPSGQRAAGLPT